MLEKLLKIKEIVSNNIDGKVKCDCGEVYGEFIFDNKIDMTKSLKIISLNLGRSFKVYTYPNSPSELNNKTIFIENSELKTKTLSKIKNEHEYMNKTNLLKLIRKEDHLKRMNNKEILQSK